MPTIVILGGSGGVGRALAPLLLRETAAHLVLAGRTARTLESAAADLGEAGRGRVTVAVADAADGASLRQAFTGADLVVVASSTSAHAAGVAQAVLAVNSDYLDVQYSRSKLAALRSQDGVITTKGRCFITDGGFHPGLPAALVRYAAPRFDRLRRVEIGSVICHDFSRTTIAPGTIGEFLEELRDYEAAVFRGGRWTPVDPYRASDYRRIDFGALGRRWCAPMLLEELREIPDRYPSLTELGFFISGFNWFVDWVVFPLAAAALKIRPGHAPAFLGRMGAWGLQALSRPPYGTILRLRAAGERGGQATSVEVELSHEDAYAFTAIPAAACLLQCLDGSIRRPGLWLQGLAVQPERFIADVRRLGVAMRLRELPDTTRQGTEAA